MAKKTFAAWEPGFELIDYILKYFNSVVAGNSSGTMSGTSYLEKGERLLTLARKKFEQFTKKFEYSTFEEALFSFKGSVTSSEFATDLAKKVIRPILAKAEINEDGTLSSDILDEMLNFIEFPITLREEKEKIPSIGRSQGVHRTERGTCVSN